MRGLQGRRPASTTATWCAAGAHAYMSPANRRRLFCLTRALRCQQHEVWNNASTARVVLMVDVWHPDLDEAGREIVRKELGFERAKWFRKDSPWGEEEPEGGDGHR